MLCSLPLHRTPRQCRMCQCHTARTRPALPWTCMCQRGREHSLLPWRIQCLGSGSLGGRGSRFRLTCPQRPWRTYQQRTLGMLQGRLCLSLCSRSPPHWGCSTLHQGYLMSRKRFLSGMAGTRLGLLLLLLCCTSQPHIVCILLCQRWSCTSLLSMGCRCLLRWPPGQCRSSLGHRAGMC